MDRAEESSFLTRKSIIEMAEERRRQPAEAAAKAWLKKKGFDPEGNLCKAVESKRAGPTTAMYEACFAGELGICRYLFDHGAASTIRTKNNYDQTPMWAASLRGKLDVARWLFEVGAAEDIRTKCRRGKTPMLVACSWGHLGVAAWLLLKGAANDEFRIMDPAILNDDIDLEIRIDLRYFVERLVSDHKAFACTVLPAVSFKQGKISSDGKKTKREHAKEGATSLQHCFMYLFHGHEDTVLAQVADFLGLVRGQELRNAREGVRLLRAAEAEQFKEDFYEGDY